MRYLENFIMHEIIVEDSQDLIYNFSTRFVYNNSGWKYGFACTNRSIYRFNKKKGRKKKQKYFILQFVKDNSGRKIKDKQEISELPFKYKDTLKR